MLASPRRGCVSHGYALAIMNGCRKRQQLCTKNTFVATSVGIYDYAGTVLYQCAIDTRFQNQDRRGHTDTAFARTVSWLHIRLCDLNLFIAAAIFLLDQRTAQCNAMLAVPGACNATYLCLVQRSFVLYTNSCCTSSVTSIIVRCLCRRPSLPARCTTRHECKDPADDALSCSRVLFVPNKDAKL